MHFRFKNFLLGCKSIVRIHGLKKIEASFHTTRNVAFIDYKDAMRKIGIMVPRKRLIPGIILGVGGICLLYGTNAYFLQKKFHPTMYVDEIVDGKKVRKKIHEIYQEMPPPNIETNERLYTQETFDKITANQDLTKQEIIHEEKLPDNKKNSVYIPSRAQYLLIGGGAASFSAARSIRTNDPLAQILIVTQENEYPYMRPPLSKELWFEDDANLVKDLLYKSWKGKNKSVYFEDASYFSSIENMETDLRGGIYILKGHKAAKINTQKSKVILQDGQEIAFEKCLVATGGHPIQLSDDIKKDLPESNLKERISYFRNIQDFKDLTQKLDQVDAKVKQPKSLAIIGGGFLGTELACGIAHKYPKEKVKVTQVIKEPGVLPKILPSYLSKWATLLLTQDGVEVLPNTTITSLTLSAKDKRTDRPKIVINTSNGSQIEADDLVVAIGITPTSEIALTSGLNIDNTNSHHGVLVDEQLKASPNIWAAGDVATILDPLNGKIRCEHHDYAISTGALAGLNMTGQEKTYNHQSMFWSDIGSQLGLEGVGLIDSSLDTIAVFANQSTSTKDKDEKVENTTSGTPESMKYGKGVVFYMKDQVLVGILAINLFGQLSIARKLLKMRLQNPDANQLSKLFDLYEEHIPSDMPSVEEQLPQL